MSFLTPSPRGLLDGKLANELVDRARLPDPGLSKESKDREALLVTGVRDGLIGDVGCGDDLTGCDARLACWFGEELEADCVCVFGTQSSSMSKGVARLTLERGFDAAEGWEGLAKATPESPVLGAWDEADWERSAALRVGAGVGVAVSLEADLEGSRGVSRSSLSLS